MLVSQKFQATHHYPAHSAHTFSHPKPYRCTPSPDNSISAYGLVSRIPADESAFCRPHILANMTGCAPDIVTIMIAAQQKDYFGRSILKSNQWRRGGAFARPARFALRRRRFPPLHSLSNWCGCVYSRLRMSASQTGATTLPASFEKGYQE